MHEGGSIEGYKMGIVHEYIVIYTYCILFIADSLIASCVSIDTHIRTYFMIHILRYTPHDMFEYEKQTI